MFIGHFGAGLAGKSVAPRVSLGTWFLSVQLLDLLWPTLLLLDVEHVEIDPGNTVMTPLNFYDYPITHSLLAVVGWGLLFGLVYFLVRRDRRSALWLGLGVVSHWLLDLLMHRPDLPLYPGEAPKWGFGLWNSLPATLLLEFLILGLGIWLYVRTTRAGNRTGRWAFWALIAFLVVVYIANIFGPPPPDVESIAWAGHLQWLFVAWGYWVDRNRSVKVS